MSRRILSRQFIVTLVLVVVFAIAGFLGGLAVAPPKVIEVPPPPAPPIKLGSASPLTGWAAAEGLEMHRGLEMAVDEINAQGGILGRKIELIELDTEDMSPEKMTSVFERLCVKEKVDFIIYGWSVTYGPQWDVSAKYGVPVMHVETVEDFIDWIKLHPEHLWLHFMADAPDTYYGHGYPVLFDHLIEQGKWKPINNKIALIRGEDAYGQRIAEVFKKDMLAKGWEVVLDETVAFGTVEYGPLLSKIRANPPAIIFNTDLAVTDVAAFMIQFREKPTQSIVCGPYWGAPEFVKMGKEAVNGVIWSTMLGMLRDEYGNKWIEKYRARYKEEPGDAAAFTYDMVWMWATATAMAGTTEPKAVCRQLEKIIYRGVCGTYRFNEEHWIYPYPDVVKDPSLGLPHLFFQVQDLESKVISPWPYAKVEFRLPPWF